MTTVIETCFWVILCNRSSSATSEYDFRIVSFYYESNVSYREIRIFFDPMQQSPATATQLPPHSDRIYSWFSHTAFSYQLGTNPGKGKVVPVFLTKHHAMKAYWGSGGITPLIIDLGTRWRWVVSFTPRPLYPQGKSSWYPFGKRLGGRWWREKFPAPAGNRTLQHRSSNLYPSAIV
jgi:hypothetical protein